MAAHFGSMKTEDALKRLPAIELATGRLVDPVSVLEIFKRPAFPVDGVERFPEPLTSWLGYRLGDTLGVRLVDPVEGEVEIVLPQKVVLRADEGLARAFFGRVNPFLEDPLPFVTGDQLLGKKIYPSQERPTWVGSEAGLVRDLASVLTFHEARWDPDNTRCVAIFWVWGETKDEKACLALEPFDCVLTGLIGYEREEYLTFLTVLQASLASLECAILERNRPLGFGGMNPGDKILNGADRLSRYRRTAFKYYSGKYAMIMPMSRLSQHEVMESFAIFNDLIELRHKLAYLKDPTSADGRATRYKQH
jgi:hypothetical protein